MVEGNHGDNVIDFYGVVIDIFLVRLFNTKKGCAFQM